MEKDLEVRYHLCYRTNDGVVRNLRFACKSEFENVEKRQMGVKGGFVELNMYKWKELRSEPFFKRFKYMYFIKSSTKEKILFLIIGAIIAIIIEGIIRWIF